MRRIQSVCELLRQVRYKIEVEPKRPQHILTETGIGYRLRLLEEVMGPTSSAEGQLKSGRQIRFRAAVVMGEAERPRSAIRFSGSHPWAPLHGHFLEEIAGLRSPCELGPNAADRAATDDGQADFF